MRVLNQLSLLFRPFVRSAASVELKGISIASSVNAAALEESLICLQRTTGNDCVNLRSIGLDMPLNKLIFSFRSLAY